LPKKYHDDCPRVERADGLDVWRYEDVQKTVTGLVVQAGAGPEGYDPSPVNYEDMRPACYEPHARLAAMDTDGVLASMVFPNFPRFCGQEFYEAKDKTLAQLSVQAYNDFILDEWSAADPARLIPAIIIPLWEPALAAREIERCAEKGARSVLFSEHPPTLGMPSIHHPDYWEPVFSAVNDARMPLSIHIGSSSKIPNTGPDSPYLIRTVLVRWVSATTCTDWMFCDALRRHPNLRIALAEGGIGWMPPLMEAASYAVDHYQYNDRFARDADDFLKVIVRDEPVKSWPHGDLKPIDIYRQHIRGCFVGGLAAYADYTRDVIARYGADMFLVEADFPHHDSSFPHTAKIIEEVIGTFAPEEQDRLRRDNAIDWYGLLG
jgi:predicted TIM-barrel fold metal-dependent hydrolase